MRERYDVLIVGTGHAGAHAGMALRQQGFSGSIGMIGEERLIPYERPPLSKSYLAGKKEFERLMLKSVAYWEHQHIHLRLDCQVTGVDAKSHEVSIAVGSPVEYGQLVWAAGGHPRQLSCPGARLPGVHYVKTVDDVDGLRLNLKSAHHVVIIGGGYIGLETAATLSDLGKQVTVLEAQDRVMARVAGEPLSRYYEQVHRHRGVSIRLRANVASIEESAGRICGVRLENHEILAADAVIVGIGIVPQVEPLRLAGALTPNGVLVNSRLQTGLADVYAIGDCALHLNRYALDGRIPIRLESIQNATDQASTVAKVIAGKAVEYDAFPWFWSEQYDLRLQTAGIALGFDDIVLRGDTRSSSFSVVYLRDERVIALDCVNASRDFIQGRSLIMHRTPVVREALSDAQRPLKELERKSGQ